AIEYDSNVWNTKYCIQQMLGSLQETERGKVLLSAQKMEIICDLWNLGDLLKEKKQEIHSKSEKLRRLEDRDIELQVALKRRRISDENIHSRSSLRLVSMYFCNSFYIYVFNRMFAWYGLLTINHL
ncbi:hypothetical protein AVEN_137455-1, partial [Araneus ventricosus]